jgi:hypothetical protein
MFHRFHPRFDNLPIGFFEAHARGSISDPVEPRVFM